MVSLHAFIHAPISWVASFPRRWQKPTDARPLCLSPDTCMTHATRALSEKTTTTGICGRAVAAGNWYQLQILLPCSRWNLYVLHEPICDLGRRAVGCLLLGLLAVMGVVIHKMESSSCSTATSEIKSYSIHVSSNYG